MKTNNNTVFKEGWQTLLSGEHLDCLSITMTRLLTEKRKIANGTITAKAKVKTIAMTTKIAMTMTRRWIKVHGH